MAKTTRQTLTVEDPNWVPNRTFPQRPAALDSLTKMDAALAFGVSTRQTVHFYGDHGIGKTSKIREFFKNIDLKEFLGKEAYANLAASVPVVRERGMKMVYINLANITPDDKLVVAPVTGKDGRLALRQLLMEDLTPGEPFSIVLDDARQAARQVQNQFMQLTNDWTIGHQDLPGLVSVVMLDNEGAAEGIRSSEDLAVADRKVTLRLNANDTGWRYALAAKYKDTDLNGVFGVWDSLPGELKHILSPRALDHVLDAVLEGFPAILGLPLVGDQRMRLTMTGDRGKVIDRTKETLEKITSALGLPYIDSTPDVVRKAIRTALRKHWAINIQGGPGIGKTAISKDEIRKAGLREVYYSMPFTDPEALVAPMPTKDGKLTALVAEELTDPSEYVIIWDEYNRPSSAASFAKLMEITQEWTLAGVPLESCRAQIALCNPSEWLGRRMQVSKGNIAQGDRFTLSIQVAADDIPANEWLLTHWPDTVSDGDPAKRERARSVIETTLEWFKNDLGDEHRQWITKRTLVRLAQLHMSGLPLEFGKIYLGEGEYAPVPLIDLEARLADRPMARLKEIAANVEDWENRLRAASEASSVGTNDVDQVHQALTLAEIPQLEENFEAVARLVRFLPPKLKITFFVDVTPEAQKLWVRIIERVKQLKDAESAA